jgi:ABC-type polysaccharide/polyol phosphate export permease
MTKNQSKPSYSPIYDSSKHRNLAIEELWSVIRYRDLIFQLVRRDIVTRYKRSALGILWTMLNPLGTMLVLSVVFSQLFDMRGTYPAYIMTNLIAWGFFSQTTSASLNAMLWGSSLFQRIYLPRTSFVVATIGTGLINTLLALVPLVLIFFVTGAPLQATALLFPVTLLLLAFFSLGISLILSTFVAFFPDIAEMYPIVLTAWMYLTPIIYPEEMLTNILGGWLSRLNPLFPIIKVFRLVVYDGRVPTAGEWGLAAGISLGTLLIGWIFFTRKSNSFAYHV